MKRTFDGFQKLSEKTSSALYSKRESLKHFGVSVGNKREILQVLSKL